MKFLIATAVLLSPFKLYSVEFKSLLSKIEGHPNIEVVRQKYIGKSSVISGDASLKDPNLRISAVNVPTSSLSFDRTPMSSKQVMLSQTIPLSSRLSHLEGQKRQLDLAGVQSVKHTKDYLKSRLWKVAARMDSLKNRLGIVEESLSWLRKVEKSTERLYSTGKSSQINLLEIKVRLADIETQKEKLVFKLYEAQNQVGYLVGESAPVKIEQVPWKHLGQLLETETPEKSPEELVLKNEFLASQYQLKSANLGFVPDLTIGASYAFRENVDGQGDFVSGFVQFSVPLWGKSDSKVRKAAADMAQRENILTRYKLEKSTRQETLKKQIESLGKETDLNEKAINYAESERRLAAKRYALGKMRIFDLLEIELRLREKRNREAILKEYLRSVLVEFHFLNGSDLDV